MILFGLDLRMTTSLHSGDFGVYGIAKRRFAEWNDYFSLLEDEYAEVDGKGN